MKFQPNENSSMYKRPSKHKVFPGQKHWNSPVGTLRLSNHWNYVNRNGDKVFVTNQGVEQGQIALCVNTNMKPAAWKVIYVFSKEDIKKPINFKEIQLAVDEAMINSLLIPQTNEAD